MLRRAVAFGRSALETLSLHDCSFVRAAADLAALIVGADLKNKQLTFAPIITGVSGNENPSRGGRGVSDVNGDADRQLAWSKQRLQHACGGSFHQCDHTCGCQHRRKLVAAFS